MNKTFATTKLANIKKESIGRILILGASGRKEMEQTINALNLEFNVLTRLSPLLSINPTGIDLNHPGFKLIADIENNNEADTVIIVANSYYIAGLLHYLQYVLEIGIPIVENIVKGGEVLLIVNEPHEKEVRFL